MTVLAVHCETQLHNIQLEFQAVETGLLHMMSSQSMIDTYSDFSIISWTMQRCTPLLYHNLPYMGEQTKLFVIFTSVTIVPSMVIWKVDSR